MGIVQTAATVALYAVAAIATGRKVSGLRYVIVNVCFTALLFGQVIAAVAYDRGGQLDDGVGTRLLEEAALWYVRLYLMVKPAFAVASTLVDIVILKSALRRAQYNNHICSDVAREMRTRMFGLHSGRLGRVEFLYGWQDVKQNAYLMIRKFGENAKLDKDNPERIMVYYRGGMMFEVIDDEDDRVKSDAESQKTSSDNESGEHVVQTNIV